MKRKLIITESQYIKLQELLFETADINSTLDYAKVGDILIFKSAPLNIKIKVTNYNRSTDEIVGETNFKGQPRKVMFKLNSYDEINKKFSYFIFDENGQNPKGVEIEPKELNIERNGALVNIPGDANAKKPEPVAKPVANPDDISKPIELDPSTDEKPDDALKAAGEEARKKIDYSKDPLLKKAFHRQAGFWDQFRAELAGKSSESDGIRSVLNMLGKYTNKKVKDKFGDTFTEDKQAKFKIISRTRLGVLNDVYTFLIRKWTEGDADTLTLTELGNKPEGLRLIVKDRKKNEPDVYLCTLKKLQDGKEQEEEIEVQFIKSAGYNPTITGKEPIKPIK